ncbi:hypothetical protein [Streptomyces lincolnensis]|uniref:hypothetical protein n=1 Tax=Streptomyces lincolnensis TaxID=1915 RepID=UPI0037CFB82D
MTSHASQSAPERPPTSPRLTAFALAVLGLDTVTRSTLRALLPAGTTKPRGPASRARWHLGERSGTGKNRTSIAFGQALREFETSGWLKRIPEAVMIRDRNGLLSYALNGQPTVTIDMLNIRGALTTVRDDLRKLRATGDPAQIEQRHEEIKALLILLHAPAVQCCTT